MVRIAKLLLVCLLCCGVAATLTACSSDDDTPAKIPAEQKGIFTDPRDGLQYGYVTYAGLDWMTENYRYDINDDVNSTVYLDADESGITSEANYSSARNLQRYGRLYTLAGAKAACPDGWRLPSDEDWQRLETALGMSAGDAATDGHPRMGESEVEHLVVGLLHPVCNRVSTRLYLVWLDDARL